MIDMDNVTKKPNNSRLLVVLSQFEAVRHRPNMYIGSVVEKEENLPIIQDGRLVSLYKKWTPGLMQLFIEIFENSLDEYKRSKIKNPKIEVRLDTDLNKVTIRDYGNGFFKGDQDHPVSGKNIVRTAMENLHAGTNFSDIGNDKVLGTHGVGASCVNILSSVFEIQTINEESKVSIVWNDFKVVDETIEKLTEPEQTGTLISFTPTPTIFNGVFDTEIIKTYLEFKRMICSYDNALQSLDIDFYIDDVLIDLCVDFLPETCVKAVDDTCTVFLFNKYENSTSVSFVNGSRCTGIHQKILNDYVNDMVDYKFAHHLYDSVIILNVPANKVTFEDQNKTRFVSTRSDIQDSILNVVSKKITDKIIGDTEFYNTLMKDIDQKLLKENIKAIKSSKKKTHKIISDKYFKPSVRKKTLILVEGLSAASGVLNARDPECDGVYALRGKVINAKRLTDIVKNAETLDLMNILSIDPTKPSKMSYDEIYIATDPDPDGIGHICPLIINLFHTWFPDVIKEGRLYILMIPLVVCNVPRKKEKVYFYDMAEYNEFAKEHKVTNLNYLKGLGSLNSDDWRYVMTHKTVLQIQSDRSAEKYLDIAFRAPSDVRKKWLSSNRLLK